MTPVDWLLKHAPLIALVITTVFWLIEHRRRTRAERELRWRDRQKAAPYFIPTSTLRRSIRLPNLSHFISMSEPYLLQVGRDEVGELKAGDYVVLVVDNLGSEFLSLSAELEGEPIEFTIEPDVADASGAMWFEYPFDPAKRGVKQRLTVRFMAPDRRMDSQVYEIRHGFRSIEWIQPPAP